MKTNLKSCKMKPQKKKRKNPSRKRSHFKILPRSSSTTVWQFSSLSLFSSHSLVKTRVQFSARTFPSRIPFDCLHCACKCFNLEWCKNLEQNGAEELHDLPPNAWWLSSMRREEGREKGNHGILKIYSPSQTTTSPRIHQKREGIAHPSGGWMSPRMKPTTTTIKNPEKEKREIPGRIFLSLTHLRRSHWTSINGRVLWCLWMHIAKGRRTPESKFTVLKTVFSLPIFKGFT